MRELIREKLTKMDPTERLTIGFFGIRAVVRRVTDPHRFSEFSVAYKTAQKTIGTEEFPLEQSYGDWLHCLSTWEELQVRAETLDPVALALPGGDGAVPKEGSGPEDFGGSDYPETGEANDD